MDTLPLLWINTEDTGPRLRYTMEVCFAFILKIPYALGKPEEKPSEAISLTLPALSARLDGVLTSGQWHSYHNLGAIFEESLVQKGRILKEGADWPALLFLLLTRYEEQATGAPKDNHGRFPAEASYQLKHGILAIPIVKIWLLQILEKVGYPLNLLPKDKSQHVTVDIDRLVWAKGDNGLIFWSKLLADFIRGQRVKVHQRWKVYQGAHDPFDATVALQFLFAHGWQPLVFLLLNPSPDGRWDRNLKPSHPLMSAFVKAFPQVHFGIHPSLASHQDPEKVKTEFSCFEDLLGYQPKCSRQHYLKINWPDTFRMLDSLGIQEEHSLVFPEMAGFRCGTSTPFPWYDLEKERKSDLMLHPPVWMDRTYFNAPLAKVHEEYTRMKECCAAYQEPFETIWHNDSLCAGLEWTPWRGFINHQLG